MESNNASLWIKLGIASLIILTILIIVIVYLVKKKKPGSSSEFSLEINSAILKVGAKWKENNKEKIELEKKEKELKKQEKGNEKLLLEYKELSEKYKSLFINEHTLLRQTVNKLKESSEVIERIGKGKSTRANLRLLMELIGEIEKNGTLPARASTWGERAEKLFGEYKNLLLKRIEEELKKEIKK